MLRWTSIVGDCILQGAPNRNLSPDAAATARPDPRCDSPLTRNSPSQARRDLEPDVVWLLVDLLCLGYVVPYLLRPIDGTGRHERHELAGRRFLPRRSAVPEREDAALHGVAEHRLEQNLRQAPIAAAPRGCTPDRLRVRLEVP